VVKRLIAICGCALVAALLAAGCGGGGGDSEEVTTSSISKAAFIKEADAACSKSEKQMQTDFGVYFKKHEKELEESQSESQFVDVIDAVMIPAVEGEIKEIRTIGAPQADQSDVEAIVAAIEEGLQNAEEDPEEAVQNTGEVLRRRTSWPPNTASRSAFSGSPWLTGQGAAMLSGRWT
jgi:hypothetical protein